MWLRLVSHRAGETLELELVAELHQVASGLWLGHLGELLMLTPGDVLAVSMPLEPATARRPPVTAVGLIRPGPGSGARAAAALPGPSYCVRRVAGG